MTTQVEETVKPQAEGKVEVYKSEKSCSFCDGIEFI